MPEIIEGGGVSTPHPTKIQRPPAGVRAHHLFFGCLALALLLWGGCADEPSGSEILDVPDPDTSDRCVSNADCTGGQVCDKGLCKDECQGAQCPCQGDASCQPGFICDTPSGLCIRLGCSNDLDCNEDEICQNAACVPRPDDIDTDGDGVFDQRDNCPEIFNPDQADSDGDNIGDLCDAEDPDLDGVDSSVDNCPDDANADQANNDGDARGDVCDPDDDNDMLLDVVDNCPLDANPGQEDLDEDDAGDVCDLDDDGDDVEDEGDNCPLNPNPSQADLDEDEIGNPCDDDWPGATIQGSLTVPEEADTTAATVTLTSDDPEQEPRISPIDPEGNFAFDALNAPQRLTLTLQWPGWILTEDLAPLQFIPDQDTVDLGTIDVSAQP